MLNFGKAVVKTRFIIIAIALALLVPSGIAYLNTRINFKASPGNRGSSACKRRHLVRQLCIAQHSCGTSA